MMGLMANVKRALTGECKDLVDPYVVVSFAGHQVDKPILICKLCSFFLWLLLISLQWKLNLAAHKERTNEDDLKLLEVFLVICYGLFIVDLYSTTIY